VRCDSIRAWGRCSAAVTAPDSAIRFEYDAPRAIGRLAIRIMNDHGAIVRHLRDGAAHGQSSRTWDVRDDQGQLVSPGAYRVRFVAPKDSLEIPFCVRPTARPPG
jgi:flagellar hook assembly protein FlgD